MTTTKKPKFSRILLKLSGEALGGAGGMGIDAGDQTRSGRCFLTM